MICLHYVHLWDIDLDLNALDALNNCAGVIFKFPYCEINTGNILSSSVTAG